MRINALVTDRLAQAKKHCDKVQCCCDDANADDSVKVYLPFSDEVKSGDIYLPTMCDEDMLEKACDYLINTDARAIVRAAFDLNEAGLIEARYKLSPIMLLHRLGVLDRCTIAGGVCLDNDDLDLMAQEDVPLILLPTADAGYGHGFAPVCAAIRRDLRVGIGTLDGKYNPDADLDFEARFLRLTANAEMSDENALSTDELNSILMFAKNNSM